MISAISGMNPYTYGVFGSYSSSRTARDHGPDKLFPSARSGMVATAQKIHQPETPVQPVTPARAVSGEDPAQAGLLRYGSDPAEMAVRMRIEYPGDNAQPGNAVGMENSAEKDGGNAQQIEDPMPGENKSAQEVTEESECQTCKERKYQDGSDDPGVSFKTPTNVAPEQAASAVRGHENEHVVREQAKARREDRKVVSQSVTYHTSICPECGRVYVSGGTTRTVTKASNSQQPEQQNENQDQRNPRVATFALA